jgi:hypothetical protein
VSQSDPLYTQLNLADRLENVAIDIDSAIAPQDGTILEITRSFIIKVSAKGGAELTKDVEAKIIVCRTETISLVDPSLITYNMYRMDVPVAHLYTLASNWTSSDTDCPANTFTLT